MTSIVLGGDNTPLAQAPTSVALQLRENLTRDEWITVGQQLGRGAQGIQWFIGDWLNYGVKHSYIKEDKLDDAEEITHMSRTWLTVCAWVARAVAPEDRRIELSFEHHKRIASLRPGPERTVLLQVAVEQRLGARDLYALATDVASPQVLPAISTVTPVQVDEPQVLIPDITGEVYELGNHRLVVGDSTDPEVWRKLFDGRPPADVLWTDAPYGVDYTGKTADEMQIQGDKAADLGTMLVQAFGLTDGRLKDGSPIYICTGFANMNVFVEIMGLIGWRFSTELIWVKNNLAIGWGDYHPKHESIVYGFKGASHRWYGPRNRSTVFGLTEVGAGPLDYTIPMPSSNALHPTMKPPKLIFEQLRNSALHGDVVLDPFAGSGSTMIAAEQLGMRAYMIEIDPKYAQVIVDRYHNEIEGKPA